MEEKGEKLSIKTKLGYGVGSVFNVMCATMVNTYMLKFYEGVIKLNGKNAGLIMLAGKITGGFSTLLVGMLSDWDKNCWIYEKCGRRKVLFY